MAEPTAQLLDPYKYEQRLAFFMSVQLWDAEKEEMVAAIRALHYRLKEAKAEGAAEYLENWARDRRRVLSDPRTIWACEPEVAESFVVDLERRAAAVRKGIAAKEGK